MPQLESSLLKTASNSYIVWGFMSFWKRTIVRITLCAVVRHRWTKCRSNVRGHLYSDRRAGVFRVYWWRAIRMTLQYVYIFLYEMPKMLTNCYSPDDRGEIDGITKYASALKWRILWNLVAWEKGLQFHRHENEKLFFFKRCKN